MTNNPAGYPAGRPDPTRPPTHPGEVLGEDVLPALNMSVAKAAETMGISRQSLHAVITGKNAVTPAMALRIGKFCGNGPGLWLRMQQTRDLWAVRQEIQTELDSIATVALHFEQSLDFRGRVYHYTSPNKGKK